MPTADAPRLQPLRIPPGWRIVLHELRELDAPTDPAEWERVRYEFAEDLLAIRHDGRRVLIDVGWYPEFNVDGTFRAVVISGSDPESWLEPAAECASRSRRVIVAAVENWLWHGWPSLPTPAQPQ